MGLKSKTEVGIWENEYKWRLRKERRREQKCILTMGEGRGVGENETLA